VTFGERIGLEDLERDPYPIYARLRDEEPVSWVPAVQLWLVTRYEDVRTVDLSPNVFTAATEPSTLNRTMGVNMLGSEGPDQERVRLVVESPFRPRDVEERTKGMIPALANELIDGFEARGECDLFREFADPMSVRSLRFMLGLDEVAWEDLLRWNQGLMIGLANFEGDPAKQGPADEASDALSEVIERVLDRLAAEPDGSVLSWMLHHDRGGARMTRNEIVSNTKLMLSGGLQEPRDLIALLVLALGSNPEQLEEVRADRRLVKPAVEETLRWAGPVGTSTRQTTETTDLAGTKLEEGALIGAVLSSANRDPRRFTDPIGSTSIGERVHIWRSRWGATSVWGRGSGGISRGSRSTSCSTDCRDSSSTLIGRPRSRAGSSELRIRPGCAGIQPERRLGRLAGQLGSMMTTGMSRSVFA
jgi:cytochrome P450